MPNWHIDLIADRLISCLRGDIQRLIICMLPRSLKSICVSVAFPAFVLGHNPRARIICASYANDLAAKHGRDCRAIMESDWYQRVFPNTSIKGQKVTEDELATSLGGGRFNVSVGGPMTGRGGNFIVIDDPIKPLDALSQVHRDKCYDWFTGTALSRLDNKKDDCIILVMQRLHEDDLAGRLMAQGGWEVLQLPAIAEEDELFTLSSGKSYQRPVGEVLHPAHEPITVLEDLRTQMGSALFSAQYQQAPVPVEGNIVHRSWIRYYDKPPTRTTEDRIVQSWDTAMKSTEFSDYSVCTTWLERGNELYLLDVYRHRLEYPDLKRVANCMVDQWQADLVLIEDKGSGSSLIQELRHQGRSIKAIQPNSDKVTRAWTAIALFEAGQVFFPKDASWLAALENELLAFPNGKHDDQVDSISQFLNWKKNRIYGPKFYMAGDIGPYEHRGPMGIRGHLSSADNYYRFGN